MKHLYTFFCLFLLTSYALADITGKAYITDGDTIKISGTKIRLDGIDAPCSGLQKPDTELRR